MVKFTKNNWGKISAIILAAILPILVLAEVNLSAPVAQLKNPLVGINSFTELIEKILEGIIKIMIPIIALAIIYSGFLFVTAQGNTEQLSKAKQALLFTVIGAALVLGAWALAMLISDTVISITPS